MGGFFCRNSNFFPRDAFVWNFILFVLYISVAKSNLPMYSAMFDILSVRSVPQYSSYIWSALGDSY